MHKDIGIHKIKLVRLKNVLIKNHVSKNKIKHVIFKMGIMVYYANNVNKSIIRLPNINVENVDNLTISFWVFYSNLFNKLLF